MRRFAFLVSVALALYGEGALAAPRKIEPAALRAAVGKLASGDPAELEAALAEVRAAGKAALSAAPAIAALLVEGTTPALTVAAIETLGELEAAAGSAALAMYARHKSLVIRDAAVRALGHTRGPAAVTALRAALSDREGLVREEAARSLLGLRSPEAAADLLTAVGRRIPGAEVAYGNSCRAERCDDLLELVTKVPFATLRAGFAPILVRSDVGEATKVRIVVALAREKNPEALVFVRGLRREASAKVKQAIDEATGDRRR